ncbi:HAD family hydrolase [Candidatus Neomarinimicrobiota bacterium]
MNSKPSRYADAGSHAIIWDFDGTLADTRLRNMHVTRSILKDITGRPTEEHAALESLESYKEALLRTANWRDLYSKEFGLPESDIQRAGQLWGAYQLLDETPAPSFAGIVEVLERWRVLPQGIVSQNGSEIITNILEANNIKNYFGAIIGYEDVEFRLQKPSPEGLIHCIRILTGLEPGLVFYIGDHGTDALCAKLGQEILAERNLDISIISIGAFYGIDPQPGLEDNFEHAAYQPAELTEIITKSLEDWPAGR